MIGHSLKVMYSDLMFIIRYQTPYTQEWRTQSFSTFEEAKRMIEFYRSCGSPAQFA